MIHNHDHHHSHAAPTNNTTAFVVGIILNSAFVFIEAIAGLYTHSMSLLADAGHNLSDVAGLALALFATKLVSKKTSNQFSFGYRQSTVLAAFLNACILLVSLGAVAYEAIMRITEPHPIEGGIVAVVAGIGIIVNSVTALMFMKDSERDINTKGAYLHMASDALISLGVVIAGMVIIYTKWYWLDSVVSLVLVAVVIFGTWSLMKESLRLTLNGVPKDIDINEVKKYFLGLNGVTDVHDLHIWAISTTETALTVHLIIPELSENDLIYESIKEELHHKFNISHSTIQIERNKGQFHCEQKC
ncbi:MAG: cation transporter [Bacteroidetes bacterium]|nr:cation transporter [Bacteroidota bacterium]